MHKHRALILGASGYVGGELLRLLSAHPRIDPAFAAGASEAGKSVGNVHPHLALAFPSMNFDRFDPAMLSDVDIVFAALPHGATQELAPSILEAGVPFVDLGADFRLDSSERFEAWYGEARRAPDLLDRFVYGIPEIHRNEIASAKAVAAAGCYATAAILTLRPLVKAGLIEAGTLVVDGMSGVSGAGKEPKAASHFDKVHGSVTAYGLLGHRHTGEMEMALGQTVLFTPHLVPVDRGILVTCHGIAAETSGDPLDVLRAAYADEPFVHVTGDAPATKALTGTNAIHMTARRCERTGRILALGAIDNLGKGAAGQMIQSANIMLGLDETAGLTTAGVWP